MIFPVGRLCVKLTGRDAGRKGVVVEVIDQNYVVIDGATRRKKVNVKHLEPLSSIIELKDKASHGEVTKALEKLGLTVLDTKKKTVAAKPKKLRVKKEKPVKEKKGSKAKQDKKDQKVATGDKEGSAETEEIA